MHEPVVARIGGGGEQAAVRPEQIRVVVVFVFVPAALRYLDVDLDGVHTAPSSRWASANRGRYESPATPKPTVKRRHQITALL